MVALSVAAVVGFFLGLLEALERLPYGQTLDIAAVGLAIAVGLGALIGVFAAPGRVSERVRVTALRAGLSGAVFAFVFEGMRLLLKIGDVTGALGAWVWAGILAIVLARLAPARAAYGSNREPARAAPDGGRRSPTRSPTERASSRATNGGQISTGEGSSAHGL